jgi:hypothetical protein
MHDAVACSANHPRNTCHDEERNRGINSGTKLESTVWYLGVEDDDAIAISEKVGL